MVIPSSGLSAHVPDGLTMILVKEQICEVQTGLGTARRGFVGSPVTNANHTCLKQQVPVLVKEETGSGHFPFGLRSPCLAFQFWCFFCSIEKGPYAIRFSCFPCYISEEFL